MFGVVGRPAAVALALLPSLAAAEPITLKLSFFASDRSNRGAPMSPIEVARSAESADGQSIVGTAIRAGIAAIALLAPLAASADPIELKFSFFASERNEAYASGVKPFVDAVNADATGLLTIKVYPDGALGKALAEQPALVLGGVADIAWVVPGQTPYRFPDNQLLEMPGLFRDVREGTLAYTRLIAANALRGYQDFHVIGAYSSAPSIIHSRKPIGSLDALRGQKIRTNNSMEAAALEQFGAIPTVMPATRLADALAKGVIDGAVMGPGGLFQFGAAQATTHHFLLEIGTAPLVVLMRRKTFDLLPEPGQALIRSYGGERAAATWIARFGPVGQRALDDIRSDPNRKAVEPSRADRETARRVYGSMRDAWAAKSPRNRDLVKMIDAELAAIRSAQ